MFMDLSVLEPHEKSFDHHIELLKIEIVRFIKMVGPKVQNG